MDGHPETGAVHGAVVKFTTQESRSLTQADETVPAGG